MEKNGAETNMGNVTKDKIPIINLDILMALLSRMDFLLIPYQIAIGKLSGLINKGKVCASKYKGDCYS